MRHLFPDKEVIGSVGLVPWRLYRGRANIVNVLWFTSAKARKTALFDEGRAVANQNMTELARLLSSASQGHNRHIYLSPLSCINKCSGRLRSISVSISRFTCSALSQQGSECSSVKCLITGAVGREGRRLDIKTLAFWKSDTLLTRVLLSQRRDLVSADCSLVLGAVSYRALVTGAH